MFPGMIKLAVRALLKIKGLTSLRKIITVASFLIYEHASPPHSLDHYALHKFT